MGAILSAWVGPPQRCSSGHEMSIKYAKTWAFTRLARRHFLLIYKIIQSLLGQTTKKISFDFLLEGPRCAIKNRQTPGLTNSWAISPTSLWLCTDRAVLMHQEALRARPTVHVDIRLSNLDSKPLMRRNEKYLKRHLPDEQVIWILGL